MKINGQFPACVCLMAAMGKMYSLTLEALRRGKPCVVSLF